MRFTCTRCEGKGTIGEEQLARVQSRVLDAVRAAKNGITIHDLIVAVYGDDLEGGPHHAENSIQVTIKNLNRRSANGKIVADKPGRGARYRLVGEHNAHRSDDRPVSRGAAGRHDHGGAAGREKE
jgi:hypothetical protein